MTARITESTFCQMLLENKLVALDALYAAVAEQKKLKASGESAKPLSKILVEKGLLSEEQVGAVLKLGKLREKPKKKTIGSFIIESKLGRGGMGAVYLAHDKVTGERVALKILPPITAGNEDYRERFLREARVSLKLSHPNIIRGRKLGSVSGIYYYVMEYFNGKSLADLLDEKTALDESEALNIALQVSLALEHAASFNIVHRDIKPENILIGKDGAVKLIDLGLAKPTAADATVTQSGITLGTPHYISPEQIRGENADFRSDIYSLGITLFETLTGIPPFDGESAGVVITKQLNDPVPPIRSVRPDLSPAIEKIVAKMTDKVRVKRYGSVKALISDLRAASGNAAES
jgi:serine/threonine-protein kinase